MESRHNQLVGQLQWDSCPEDVLVLDKWQKTFHRDHGFSNLNHYDKSWIMNLEHNMATPDCLPYSCINLFLDLRQIQKDLKLFVDVLDHLIYIFF